MAGVAVALATPCNDGGGNGLAGEVYLTLCEHAFEVAAGGGEIRYLGPLADDATAARLHMDAEDLAELREGELAVPLTWDQVRVGARRPGVRAGWSLAETLEVPASAEGLRLGRLPGARGGGPLRVPAVLHLCAADPAAHDLGVVLWQTVGPSPGGWSKLPVTDGPLPACPAAITTPRRTDAPRR